MLLHAALFLGALSLATTIVALWPGLIGARLWAGLPVSMGLIALVTWNASIAGGEPNLDVQLAVIAFVVTAVVRLAIRHWSWLGAQLFGTAGLASIAYLAYAATITYAVASDVVYLIGSTLLLLLELAALALSLSYLFEIVDTLSVAAEDSHASDPNDLPKAAIPGAFHHHAAASA